MLEVRVGDFHETFAADVPEVVIGRSANAHVRVDDPRVSRVQAIVRRRGDVWQLEDQRSANGTFVHGRAVGVLDIHEPVVVRLADPDDGIAVYLTPADAERSDSVDSTVVPRRDDVGVIRIGRAGDNDVVLEDSLVSRYHAEIRRRGPGRWELCDNGSANGIYVDGRRVESVAIDDTVRVELGEHLLHVVPDARGGVRVEVIAHGHTMRVAAQPDVPATDQPGADVNVTPRERELLALVAGGATDRQIADELFISIRTVRSHLDRIQDKTGMRRRADLTRLALDLGVEPRRPGGEP